MDAQEKAADLTIDVIFDFQGGALNVKDGDIATAVANIYDGLPNPVREGYLFCGWWIKTDGAEMQVLPSNMLSIEPNQTLFAKWFGPLQIGSIGPAGGYIFYDKGSYSEGWQYLEAAPANYDYGNKVWGGYGTDLGTSSAIGTGKSNTEKIVSKFGNSEPWNRTADYAAKLCFDLVLTKDGQVFDDWFLPSIDELDQMYRNLFRNKIGDFYKGFYWSSSEDSPKYAWSQLFDGGSRINDSPYGEHRVRPVRAF